MTANLGDATDLGDSNDPQPLEQVTVAGFKSIGPVQSLQMRRVNIVIGANGSGKSNLVKVFAFLEAIRAGRLQEYVARAGGADRILHFGAKTTDELIIDVSFRSDTNRYELGLVPDDTGRLVPVREVVHFWDKAKYERSYSEALFPAGVEAGISRDVPAGISSWIQARLDRWKLYHFHDTGPRSPLVKTCALHDNEFLRADGANLAAFLYLLREKYEESYGLIRRSVRLVAPFFKDFVLRPMPFNENMIRLEWSHVGTDAYFDASSLSDGTLRFIALATLLLQPSRMLPSVVLLDEPELGLHPYAITMLCSLVKSGAVRTQVVIATQSPLMLDHFDPEDLLVAERREGASTFTRLDSGDLEAWLEDYSLGQLWEKNELGGRPSTENAVTR